MKPELDIQRKVNIILSGERLGVAHGKAELKIQIRMTDVDSSLDTDVDV